MESLATPMDLRAVLAALGDTAGIAADLVAGIDETALHTAAPGALSCRDIVQELVDASFALGRVAHEVLGHVPGASGAATAEQAGRPSAKQLLLQLRFLREHIVSTVDQQGAAVWATLTEAGRPLFAYAVDLLQQDAAWLNTLWQAATAARQRGPHGRANTSTGQSGS
jgi:hypothetical protein